MSKHMVIYVNHNLRSEVTQQGDQYFISCYENDRLVCRENTSNYNDAVVMAESFTNVQRSQTFLSE